MPKAKKRSSKRGEPKYTLQLTWDELRALESGVSLHDDSMHDLWEEGDLPKAMEAPWKSLVRKVWKLAKEAKAELPGNWRNEQ